ncbi:unnamed protein product, partial [Staurois parvus]
LGPQNSYSGTDRIVTECQRIVIRATETLLGPQNCYSGTDTELLLSARELLLRATETELLLRATETLLGPQNCYSGTDRIVTECQR